MTARPKRPDPAWLSEGARHLWRPYAQMKTASPALPVVATRGSRITLADGSELVDGIASWWTACHGYNHPHILDAMRAQLSAMPHVMLGGLAHEPACRLATRLGALTRLDHVFFSESGSVAVEVAMKMAVQYRLNRGERGRHRILAFRGAYHGDTFATMAVCDPEEGMHALFAGATPEQVIADLPRDDASEAALRALLDARGAEITAMIVEPRVQGRGRHDLSRRRRARAPARGRRRL